MINEVEWFCYLGAENQFFDKNTIVELMQISPDDVDLMSFAQAVLDNGLATMESVQQLLEHASYYANQSGPCPHSLLGGGAVAPAASVSGLDTTDYCSKVFASFNNVKSVASL